MPRGRWTRVGSPSWPRGGGVIRLAALVYLGRFPLKSDSLAYHGMALSLLHDDGFTPFYPPGVPCVLAAAYRLAGASELVGRATGLLWYFALALLLYRLASMMGGRRAANLALLVVACFPALVWHSTEPLTQLPTAVLLLLICYLSVLARRDPTWRRLTLLGVVMGAAVLTRPSSLLLAVAVPAVLSVSSKRARAAVVPLVVGALIVGAWLVKVHAMTGRVLFINDANTRNLFYGNNPYTPLYKTWWFGSHGAGEVGVPPAYTEMLHAIEERPAAEQDRAFRRIARAHILSRPDLFLLRTINRLSIYFAFDTFTGSALRKMYGASTPIALGVIGLDAFFYCMILLASVLVLFTWRAGRSSTGEITMILLVVACYSAPYWFSFSHPTYHIPIMPLLSLLGAVFVDRLATAPGREVFLAVTSSARRRYGLAFTLLVLALIQIEWVVFGLARV